MIEENKAKQMTNEAILKNIIDDFPHYINLMAYAAKASKVRYDAYITEGFTPEQAIYLCKDGK